MKSPARQAVKRDIKHSMALLLHGDPSPHSSSPAQPHLSPLSSPDQRTHRQIEILNWRIKTSLPVVKPIHFALLQNTRPDTRKTTLPDRPWVKKSSEKEVGRRSEQGKGLPGVAAGEREAEGEVSVEIEEIKWRLDEVGILSLPQILHLLKEMMVGYDVLVDIFGTFHPSARMVALNAHSQWRVWVHEDFAFNSKPPTSHPPTHREFIYSLLCLTEHHCAMTNLARTFFSETKQLTFSEHCTFIRVIEKIKDFVTQHRIFMVSKFSLPVDKQERHHLHHEPEKDKSKKHVNVVRSPLKNFEKKEGFKNGHLLSPPHNRSFNLVGSQGAASSISQFINYRSIQSHATSPNARPSVCNLTIPTNFMSSFTSLRATGCSQLLNNSVQLKNVFSSRNLREQDQPNHEEEKISAKKKQLGMSTNLHVSPPPHLQRKMASPTANNPVLNKSRREIKAIVNTPDPVITVVPVTPSHSKARKTQRKYSEQLFKARSLDMLQAKRAKVHGSNIFEQDPETRQAVNIEVVKRHETIHTPSGKKTNETSDKQGVGSPIDSSLSSKELQNSQEREFTHKEPNYKNLKINDLNNGKARNNLSSYYGGVSQDEINKNMATSYSFKNRNQIKSESSNDQSSPDKKGQNNNQWAKKISGLFSDDASIKHLKGSVKFKTRDEDLFEKEFLKDVKLDMLEQFGRKVRHSIVDQQNDFDQRHNTTFKQMQLIEQVFDDEGKSHIEKEDLQDEDIPARSIRSRHQTVQINNLIKEEEPASKAENKECLSEYFESDSEDCFNFESEMYVINPKN